MTTPEGSRGEGDQGTFSSANNAEILQAAQAAQLGEGTEAEPAEPAEPIYTYESWDKAKAAAMQPFVHSGLEVQREGLQDRWNKLQELQRPGLLEERVVAVTEDIQQKLADEQRRYAQAKVENNEQTMKVYGEAKEGVQARIDRARDEVQMRLEREIAEAKAEYNNQLLGMTAIASELYDVNPTRFQRREDFAEAMKEFEPLATQRNAAAFVVRAIDGFEAALERFNQPTREASVSYLSEPSLWDKQDRFTLKDALDTAIPSRLKRREGYRSADGTEGTTEDPTEIAVNEAYSEFDEALKGISEEHKQALDAITTEVQEDTKGMLPSRPPMPDNYDTLTGPEKAALRNSKPTNWQAEAVRATGEERKRAVTAEYNDRRRKVLHDLKAKVEALLAERSKAADKVKRDYSEEVASRDDA